jgi:hypothetical protein
MTVLFALYLHNFGLLHNLLILNPCMQVITGTIITYLCKQKGDRQTDLIKENIYFIIGNIIKSVKTKKALALH